MIDPEDHIMEQEQDLFEARYFGTLSAEERDEFDRKLQADRSFHDRYETFKLALSAIENSGEAGADTKELRARLQQIDQELDRKEVNMTWLWAAAAVLVLFLGGWWFLGGDSDTQLAEEFELPEPGLPVLMSDNRSRFDPLMNSLKLDDHAAADQQIEELFRSTPDNDTLHYFAGIIHARSQRCATAIAHFASVDGTSTFHSKASYHRAICHLKEGDRERAREQLMQVKDVQLRERADRLLARL
jgi:tetratricopeptide (TPR) repeat protein